MTAADGACGILSGQHGFQEFENLANDVVLAASFNASGTKVALCSADHRIRVYNIDEGKAWHLADQWRGHDAEILDIQWIAPRLGQFFATIGGDNKFKVWREDLSQLHNQGRRFKCIFSQSPPNHASYVCFASTMMNNGDIFLALMAHDGLLSLIEPEDCESLKSWSQHDSFYPVGQITRGSESRFSLSFQHSERLRAMAAETIPNPPLLAVSASNSIKVFGASKHDNPEGTYQLNEEFTVHIEATLINEIAWAPGCIRPFDVIAAACEDGTVRIFEIDTFHDSEGTLTEFDTRSTHSNVSVRADHSRNPPSGIGAGLAGISRNAEGRNDFANERNHVYREMAVLEHSDGAAVWKLRWLHDGSALASTGDSGKVHLWRETVLGNYVEFAETEAA